MKHTRARHLVLSALSGAAAGALLVFFTLVLLGTRRESPEDSQAELPAVRERVPAETEGKVELPSASSPSPSATGSSSAASPTKRVSPSPATKEKNLVSIPEGKFTFTLPKGYRVAADISRLERSQVPGRITTTITRGSEEDEKKFVALVEQLRQDQTATEAPVFLPGQTITVSLGGPDAQQSDAQLARAEEALTTRHGLSGTRYRRVEGLYTYDSAYVRLAGGNAVAVQMGYGSEEPYLDERAFTDVIESLQDHASDDRPASE